MTPWAWYWRDPDEDSYGDEHATREAVIEAARREMKPGSTVEIIEARMSEAREHEGSDFIPFLRSRNKERITLPEATTANAVGTSAASAPNHPTKA